MECLANSVRMRQIGSLFLILLITGCVTIPDADNTFLHRQINIGSSEDLSTTEIEARGFSEISVTQAKQYVFNHNTEKFDSRPATFEETVQSNLGLNPIVGEPEGQLRCFQRKYWRFVASGVRIICWTSDTSGKLTWRQASWRGASL